MICEKCKKNSATHTLEITLIKICARCYTKILEARIQTQLKKSKNTNYSIHSFSLRFFTWEQSSLFKEKIKSIHDKKEYQSNITALKNNEISNNTKLFFATKEQLAIMLIEYLSPSSSIMKEEITNIMREIKELITIVPFAQFSINELAILFENQNIKNISQNDDFLNIQKTILELEKTHKDASSGLAKSFLEICSLFPEKE